MLTTRPDLVPRRPCSFVPTLVLFKSNLSPGSTGQKGKEQELAKSLIFFNLKTKTYGVKNMKKGRLEERVGWVGMGGGGGGGKGITQIYARFTD